MCKKGTGGYARNRGPLGPHVQIHLTIQQQKQEVYIHWIYKLYSHWSVA
jgi:hypothetical protein